MSYGGYTKLPSMDQNTPLCGEVTLARYFFYSQDVKEILRAKRIDLEQLVEEVLGVLSANDDRVIRRSFNFSGIKMVCNFNYLATIRDIVFDNVDYSDPSVSTCIIECRLSEECERADSALSLNEQV